MNTIKRHLLFSSVSVILTLNLVCGILIYHYSKAGSDDDNLYNNMELFSRVLDQVRDNHVDRDKLSYSGLIRNALRGMLNSLDGHSEFMDDKKYSMLLADTEGAFGGVGIMVGTRDNHLTVIAPMADKPAHQAGVMSGDRIVRIMDQPTKDISFQDAVQLMRGKVGTDVRMTIFRPVTGETKTFTLTRTIITVETVRDLAGGKEYPLDEDGIGYIRVTQFGEKTSDAIRQALERLATQNMQALILDLRDNPGGLLDQAVKVSELFLEKGQIIVSTQGQRPVLHQTRRAQAEDPLLDVPMAILVNRDSASASEIVAGCLQDLKRAIIVGDKTFGKGSVQSILPQPDGSALRLTTAKYYTPSEKVIDNNGITPDILVTISSEEQQALDYQRTPGGVDSFTDLSETDRNKYRSTPDTALNRARMILQGIRLHFSLGQPSGTRQVPQSN